MTDNVIPLRPKPEGYDGRKCECGSAWFTVEAVCVDALGHVSGYTTPVHCRDCGVEQPWPRL